MSDVRKTSLLFPRRTGKPMKHYRAALLALCFLVSACDGKKPIENTEDAAKTTENEQMAISIERDENIVVSSGTMFIAIGEDEDTSADFSGITYFQDHDITDIYISLLLDAEEIDFSPLSHLQHLSWVKLGGWGVTVIPDFRASPSIKHLEIWHGSLTSLDGIEKMPSLEYLEISNNRVHLADMSALRYLANLRSLNIYAGFYNIDFSVLKDLPSLTELCLQDIGEINLLDVAELASLEKLSLYSDEVSFPSLDVSPLSRLTNLQELRIIGFEIENIESLDALPNLDYIITRRNTRFD